MNVFQLYMLGRLAFYTVAITAVLSLAVLALNPFELFEFWTLGTLPLDRMVLANVMAIPLLLCQTGPIGVTIATIVLYCQWTSDNQILSLRSIGLSDWSIAAPGIVVGAIATLLMALTTLYLMAATFPTFADIVYAASSRFPYHGLTPGYLNYVGPDVALSFERWSSSNTAEGVRVLDWRTPGVSVDIHAETAQFVEGEAGAVAMLFNGTYLRRNSDTESTEPVVFEEMSVMVRPRIDTSSRGKGIFEQRIDHLINPPTYIQREVQQWPEWVAEGHQRFVTPMLCLNYVLLSLGVLLTGPRTRSGMILRLGALSFALALLHYAMLITHQQVVYFPRYLPLLYVFAFVPAAAGAALITLKNRAKPSFLACRRAVTEPADSAHHVTGRRRTPSDTPPEAVNADLA
jgi:lipopolysaccharide export system permease protein